MCVRLPLTPLPSREGGAARVVEESRGKWFPGGKNYDFVARFEGTPQQQNKSHIITLFNNREPPFARSTLKHTHNHGGEKRNKPSVAFKTKRKEFHPHLKGKVNTHPKTPHIRNHFYPIKHHVGAFARMRGLAKKRGVVRLFNMAGMPRLCSGVRECLRSRPLFGHAPFRHVARSTTLKRVLASKFI